MWHRNSSATCECHSNIFATCVTEIVDAKQTAYRAWCRARNAEHCGQFVLARTKAQRVYGAARESHNERTRNTLKHSTCSHKWWETLKGSIFVVKPSIPTLKGPGGGLVVAPGKKAWFLASQFDSKQCRSAVCHSFVLFPSVSVQFFGLPNFGPPVSASRSWYVRGGVVDPLGVCPLFLKKVADIFRFPEL